jgi:hypothetical protein
MIFLHPLNSLTAFIAANFPGWGRCSFSFDADHRILYLYPETARNRAAILADRDRLAQLDVGIDQFIIIHSDYSAITIATLRNSI